jgi:hypothetical protein
LTPPRLQRDEWLVGRCYLSRQSMELLRTARTETTTPPRRINKEVGELVAA